MTVTLIGRNGYEVVKTGVSKINEYPNNFMLIYNDGTSSVFNKKIATYEIISNKEK